MDYDNYEVEVYLMNDTYNAKKRYYENNKEKINKHCLKYQQEHREEKKTANQTYYLKNQEILKAKRRAKYAREKEAKLTLQ